MKRLARGAIGTGAGTLAYTVPIQYTGEVNDICISNTTSSTATCTLHLVPSGGSPAASNMLLPTVSIDANTLFQLTGNQMLDAGDYIQVIGSISGLTMNITGDEKR